jgi:glycosyltransferase involved in cell wall biosynthesis
VTVSTNKPENARGYRIFNILSNSPLRYINLFYFFTLRNIIRKEGITHVMLEHPYYGWLGMLLKTFCGVKLVVHSQNIETTRWKSLGKWWWRILFWYEGATHRSAQYNLFIHDDDRAYATSRFKLKASTCITSTYGIEWNTLPSAEEKQRCRQVLLKQYGLQPGIKLLLFNGSLNYIPNLQAVKIILEEINPLLLKQSLDYRIIICGKGLPGSFNELKDYAGKNILYAGFVDDISVYFKGVDVFLNPVLEGGGIKTKLVEALGYNTASVSTVSGATGVTQADAGEMISIVSDNDWTSFVQAIIAMSANKGNVPPVFFSTFYWGNIARTAIEFISR